MEQCTSHVDSREPDDADKGVHTTETSVAYNLYFSSNTQTPNRNCTPSRRPPSPLPSPALPLSLPDSVHGHVPVNRSLELRRKGVPRRAGRADPELLQRHKQLVLSLRMHNLQLFHHFRLLRLLLLPLAARPAHARAARVLSSWTASCTKTTGVRRGAQAAT